MSGVLAIAEHRRGELREVSLELVTAGRELADAIEGPLSVGLIGSGVDPFVDELNCAGVDTIFVVAEGDEFNHDVHTQVVEALATRVEPSVVLLPHSANGLDYAPAVATRLGVPLVTDAVELDVDGGSLGVTRELYGSKMEATVEVDAERVVVTIRPGQWECATAAGEATVESVTVDVDGSSIRSSVVCFEDAELGDVDIANADVLVGVGRGIEHVDHLELVEELADALRGTVSASRPIVDRGWLPRSRLVGQSGRTVTPDVYVAIGISGASQHVAGVKGARIVVAINTDSKAPIFDVADYGIVGDYRDVVPALLEELRDGPRGG